MTLRAKRHSGAFAALAVLAAATLPLATPAAAFAKEPSLVNRTHEVSDTVTVKAIDKPTRHLTLTNGKGETYTLKAPAEFRRFDSLKPGDKIHVTYRAEVELVLSEPGGALPKDAAGMIAVRNRADATPGAVGASYLTVTGAVLGIDMAAHTIKIVSPQGGEVHTVAITREDGRKAMSRLKVGDKITAYVTESLLLAMTPA
jgi:hypothetical protein